VRRLLRKWRKGKENDCKREKKEDNKLVRRKKGGE